MSALGLMTLAFMAGVIVSLLLSETLAEVAPDHPLRREARLIAAAFTLATTLTLAARFVLVLS